MGSCLGRKTLLLALESAWNRNPHLRFMQLIGNIIQRGENGFYLEDDEVEMRLWKYEELVGKTEKGQT